MVDSRLSPILASRELMRHRPKRAAFLPARRWNRLVVNTKNASGKAANLGFGGTLRITSGKPMNNMDTAEQKPAVLGLILPKLMSDASDEHRDRLVVGKEDWSNIGEKGDLRVGNIISVSEEPRWSKLQTRDGQPAIAVIERGSARLEGITSIDQRRSGDSWPLCLGNI